jgi:hypothetical protein
MRRIFSGLSILGSLAFFAGLAVADSITLNNGETIRGTYLGGTARQVRMDVNGSIQTFDVGQIQTISFVGDYNPGRPPAGPDPNYQRDRYGYTQNPPPAPPYGQMGITVPVDTRITVRMIESVNSQTVRLGQTFRASIDEPVFVNGQEVIPRGADVLTKLVEDQQSGKIQGRTALSLALVTITVNGREVPVTSSDVRTESSSRGTRSAEVVGGGAALGAIVGAIAGGGKGAAIGAASGGALGAGAEVLTKGQVVKIPSETRLSFRLQAPMQL